MATPQFHVTSTWLASCFRWAVLRVSASLPGGIYSIFCVSASGVGMPTTSHGGLFHYGGIRETEKPKTKTKRSVRKEGEGERRERPGLRGAEPWGVAGPGGPRLWKHLLSFFCDSPSGASGKSWTRRTSCRSCGQMPCLRRCGTGWPPPSPSRPGPKAAAQRRSPSSGALCTRCRLGSSWNGEACPRSASLCL